MDNVFNFIYNKYNITDFTHILCVKNLNIPFLLNKNDTKYFWDLVNNVKDELLIYQIDNLPNGKIHYTVHYSKISQ